jgi:hypothetical protein
VKKGSRLEELIWNIPRQAVTNATLKPSVRREKEEEEEALVIMKFVKEKKKLKLS